MAVPAWRLALLERKKKQEEDEKVKKAQEEEAKLASLPAWKRAILLREKQGKAEPPAATKQQLNSTSQKSPAKLPGKLSNKWQVAVERVKGPDSPVLKQKFTHPAPSNPAPSTSPAPSSPKLPPAVTTTLASPKQVTRNQVVNRWKHAAPKEPASPKITPVVRNNFKPAALSTPAPQAKQDEEDSSLAGLPAWKKALILKRRQAQQPPVAVNSSQPPAATNNSQPPAPTNSSSETNTVSGHREEATVNGAKSTTVKTVSKHSQSLQPEVVNRKDVTASTETANQRLVEQEGITLHPPVYKEVDEWANVKEDDDKFKDLPLWKQALIKRRRADIAKRSGLPVTVTPTLPPAATPSSTSASRTQAPDSPTTKKERKTHWKQAQNKTSANTRPSVTEQKKSSGVLSSRVSNHYTSSKASSTTKSTKSNRSEDLKPARKAPAPPPAKNKEEMFTYNFSKSSRRTLDTGGSSSDSTDSDLEDAIITNLDESSDEDDSGIVLQKYTKSSEQSPNLGKKSHSDTSVVSKSALSTPGKKKKHMRRVSWSDTQLVSEHFYPKYDYSDYEEIEEEQTQVTTSSKGNSGLSHRVHPSLRQSGDADPYGYEFTSTSPRSQTSDSSLSSFVPKSLSAYSPSGYTAPESSPKANGNHELEVDGAQEPQQTEQQTDDYYADLTSNTAALLW